MKTLTDVRMHGAANRFLIHFGNKNSKTLLQELEGADGVLIVQEDDRADAFMMVFNADGSEAGQCGNGMRCVALHLVRSRVVEGSELTIRTTTGTSRCLVYEDRNEVEVLLCVPRSGPGSCDVDVSATSDLPELHFVNVGNPNAVLWTVDDPIEVRQRLGATISEHPAFVHGMNVHFARRDDPQHAMCASWERGVGVTHASGSGGAAVFVASHAPEKLYVSSVGGTLSYTYDDSGAIVMIGPACYE